MELGLRLDVDLEILVVYRLDDSRGFEVMLVDVCLEVNKTVLSVLAYTNNGNLVL